MPLVAGWSSTSPYNTVWQSHLSPSTHRAYNAEIEIVYTNISDDATFNPDTGDYEYSDIETVVYSGPARIQPLRTASDRGQTSVQTVLFSIADLSVNVLRKYRVRVISCAENVNLSRYKFVVSEITDSSNPLERTFYAVQDIEVQ